MVVVIIGGVIMSVPQGYECDSCLEPITSEHYSIWCGITHCNRCVNACGTKGCPGCKEDNYSSALLKAQQRVEAIIKLQKGERI